VTYLVNEIFTTIQGEASFAGTPSVFIRLQGCDVGCAFCDTKHTWARKTEDQISVDDMLAKAVEAPTHALMDAAQIIKAITPHSVRHAVITGGEPADYDLFPLTDALLEAGFMPQVETSGTSEIRVHAATFVTLSPKIGMPGKKPVLRQVVERADEIKHPAAIEPHLRALQQLLAMGWHRGDIPIWLQPLSQSPTATRRCTEWCIKHGYRLSIQTHKFIGLR